jgi:hypothetical protein
MKQPLDQLDAVANLPANWDGEGAEKPSAVAVRNAKLFLMDLAVAGEPSMSACANGSVDAYWRTRSGPILVNFNTHGGMAFYAEIAGFKLKGESPIQETCADESLRERSDLMHKPAEF